MSNKVKLSEIAYIKMGQSPSGETCNEIGNGIALLNGPAEFTSYNPLPKQYTIDGKRFSEKGDILFCVRGSTTGRMNWADQKYALGRGLASISHKKGNEYNHFLKFLLQSNLKSLLNAANGSTFPNLTSDILASFELSVPEEKTQKTISFFLQNIDSKIELNNRINAELEAMAKTLYDYWFVQFDFPNANGKPYKSSGGKMVWNEELKREIPEGWEKGNLFSLGEIIGGSTPPREIEEYFTANGTAWITPKDLSLNTGNKFISKGELDVSEKGIKAASLNIMPKGTILLSSRAPVGYLAISRESVTTNQGFKSFVPNKGFSTEFVYYSIKNMIPAIENNAVGSTFKEISAATLKTIPICLPDKKVVEIHSEIVKPIFERQNNLEIENQKLTELRDWLLPMLMNGQVKVMDEMENELSMAAEPKIEYGK
jgi:type I restriction enzyme S subunit